MSAPANFREIGFNIGGMDIKEGGMPRPDYSGTTENSMTYLQNQGYGVIFSLNPKEEYATCATAHGIEYKQVNVIDFTPPSIDVCESAFQTIKEAAEAGKKVGVHCGEGFGRTGTVLSAVKLKELMLVLQIN